MKKRGSIFCAWIAAVMLCTGCAGASPLPLEQIHWEMSYIQSGEDGKILATSPEGKEDYGPQEVEMINMTCQFSGLDFVITNEDSGQSWKGTFQEIEKGLQHDTIYEATYEDGSTGLASSGITSYADGSKEGTLIFTGEKYTIGFRGDLPEG